MASTSDGGVEYLSRVLAESVSPDTKFALLTKREADARNRLCALLAEHSPEDSAASRRREDIEQVMNAIDQALRTKQADPTVRDPAAWVGLRLRRLFDVDPEVLDPIPAHAQKQKIGNYVDAQILKWINSKRLLHGLEELGLAEWGRRARILGYLAERVENQVITKWIREELGNITSMMDAREARRVLSVYLSKMILMNGSSSNGLLQHPPLGGEDGVLSHVRQWAEIEEESSIEGYRRYEDSPHFGAVVVPVFDVFNALAKGRSAERQRQPGDPEVQQLYAEAMRMSTGASR
jgi:hypothetical protein